MNTMRESVISRIKQLRDAGIKEYYSDRKKRAIRISNLLTLNGINICMPFIIAFLINDETRMVISVGLCALMYLCGYLITAAHRPHLGRSITLISGCLCIMDMALYYGGNSHAQFLLLCMASVPLIMIEWEALSLIIFLQLIPVVMVIYGEVTNYSLYTIVAHDQDLRLIQRLSLIIGFSQTIFGFYLFARQSVFFEDEAHRYIKELDIEHQKQIQIQIQKMSALGEMSGGVAHEINNPLQIISIKCTLLIEMVKSKQHDPNLLIEGIQKILETTGRIARIVKALRDFSRNAEGDPIIEVDPVTVIDDALSLSEMRMEKSGIKVKTDFHTDSKILCRPAQLAQVLINLFNNSIDAIKGTNDAWLKIETRARDSMVDIYVTDSGKGIAPAIAEKMMQPFFTTKEIGKGTGLGLSISKGLTESMQGELVFVNTSPNTQFRISLRAVGIQ